MKVEWEIFKQFVDERKVSIQWIDLGNQYWLKAFDNNFSLQCFLDKTESVDLTSFETNYKSYGNQSPKNQVLTEPANLSITMYRATNVVEVAAGEESIIDFCLVPSGEEFLQILYGGALYTKEYDFGDYVKFQVIDLDGILAPEGTVLKEYINKAYLNNNGVFEDYDEAGAELPVGLYLRCIYKSMKETGTTKVKINYLLGLKN